jgi:hypothetical protein
MKLVVAILIVMVGVCGNVFSQEGFQNYHQSSQMGMASPGAFRYGLNGYDNPAVLGVLLLPMVWERCWGFITNVWEWITQQRIR